MLKYLARLIPRLAVVASLICATALAQEPTETFIAETAERAMETFNTPGMAIFILSLPSRPHSLSRLPRLCRPIRPPRHVARFLSQEPRSLFPRTTACSSLTRESQERAPRTPGE